MSGNKPVITIAYLFGSLTRGGSENLLLDVFRHMQGNGKKIIGIYRIKGPLLGELRNTGIQMYHIKPRFKFDLTYLLRLRKALKKNNVKIVHAQQAIDAMYARLACLGTGIKVVLTFHGYNFKRNKRLDRITRIMINRTHTNVYVSQSQLDEYIKEYKIKDSSKHIVIYNGVSFEKFEEINQKSLREEFNIPNTSILLGSVGNFVQVRDQMTICRFLNLLNQGNIDFAFIFVGRKLESTPWFYDDCIDYCKAHGLLDRVFFPGARGDVPSILSQLDAFIYSTNHDTFGIAVIEAMATGIPVFTNDWKVMEEVTQNGRHGVLYHTKDEDDLLAKFLDFVKNREVYIKKASEDAKWVKEKYSIQKHLEKLIATYKKIL